MPEPAGVCWRSVGVGSRLRSVKLVVRPRSMTKFGWMRGMTVRTCPLGVKVDLIWLFLWSNAAQNNWQTIAQTTGTIYIYIYIYTRVGLIFLLSISSRRFPLTWLILTLLIYINFNLIINSRNILAVWQLLSGRRLPRPQDQQQRHPRPLPPLLRPASQTNSNSLSLSFSMAGCVIFF